MTCYAGGFSERCEPVMKYMGDQPSKQGRVGNELTDEIFEPALKHVCHSLACHFTLRLLSVHAGMHNEAGCICLYPSAGVQSPVWT